MFLPQLAWHQNNQRSKFNVHFLFSKYVASNFETLLVSLPIEIEVHTLPHFKAPVNGKVELYLLDHAATFSSNTAL